RRRGSRRQEGWSLQQAARQHQGGVGRPFRRTQGAARRGQAQGRGGTRPAEGRGTKAGRTRGRAACRGAGCTARTRSTPGQCRVPSAGPPPSAPVRPTPGPATFGPAIAFGAATTRTRPATVFGAATTHTRLSTPPHRTPPPPLPQRLSARPAALLPTPAGPPPPPPLLLPPRPPGTTAAHHLPAASALPRALTDTIHRATPATRWGLVDPHRPGSQANLVVSHPTWVAPVDLHRPVAPNIHRGAPTAPTTSVADFISSTISAPSSPTSHGRRGAAAVVGARRSP